MMLIGSTRSILIADDDDEVRDSLFEVLSPGGFRLHLANCGEAAIEIVQRHEVHLVLLDMHMPRLDGLETMRRVRQIRGPLPMILISGELDDQLRLRALQAHAFCALAKPLSHRLIRQTVASALDQHYGAGGGPEPG